MNDKLGKEIAVGDYVVFGQGQHMNLLLGHVTKINKKTVTISRTYTYKRWGDGKVIEQTEVVNRAPDNLIVLEPL